MFFASRLHGKLLIINSRNKHKNVMFGIKRLIKMAMIRERRAEGSEMDGGDVKAL